METIRNLSIATKLRVAFAIMLALMIVQALFAYARLQSVQGEARALGTNWLPSVSQVSGIDSGLADYRIGLLQTLGATTPDQLQAAERNVAKGLTDFKASAERYEKLISGDEERRIYEKLRASAGRFDAAAQRAIAAAKAQQLDEARRIYDQDTRPAYREAADAANELVQLNNRGAEAATARSEALYRSSVGWLIASTVVAVLMAMGLAWLLVRAITAPLSAAVRAADRVAAGDLSERIDAGAGGRSHGRDEIAHLLEAMARMQQALVGTVGSVRGGAESVAMASVQIAQGNADLSSRTEDQASSLEQTSATMEQLNATVRQNADNAAQANQLAQSATQVARDGGQVVGEVVETMHGIEESSRRIADIIATIDGIAFQTNILALNAAVEAARAGEQGRGFAVVAGEVRLLAQRSAEAAKEIKSLIGASVERVQSGTALVDRAGATIANIVGAVQKLADLVGEISSASREQSSGIAQVGAAVSQLDRATQQNAALVEQSAAASESLKGQAQALLTAVAGFKLAAGAAPVAAPAPVPKAPAPHKAAAAATIAAARAKMPTGAKAAAKASAAAPRAAPQPPAAAEADGEWASF